MTDRLLILTALIGIGTAAWGLLTMYRRRHPTTPDRLAVSDLGLELMEGCCAFVVFTSPSCRPCKAALRVVTRAVAAHRGVTEIVTVDAVARPDVALSCDVRSVPTVFLITASGHVVRSWRSVPEEQDALTALRAI